MAAAVVDVQIMIIAVKPLMGNQNHEKRSLTFADSRQLHRPIPEVISLPSIPRSPQLYNIPVFAPWLRFFFSPMPISVSPDSMRSYRLQSQPGFSRAWSLVSIVLRQIDKPRLAGNFIDGSRFHLYGKQPLIIAHCTQRAR